MSDRKQSNSLFAMDWRVVFGISITAIWILLGVSYLLAVVGLVEFINLPTGDIGSFLEGAFAPLAFLWLVIGHFMQHSEISANTKAIKLQEESAHRQEIHAQRNSYFKLLNLIQDQLGAIAGFHYMSVCGPTGLKEITTEQYASLRGESASGDSALFVRYMVSLAARYNEDQAGLEEVFLGTAIRERHTSNFAGTFGKLIQSAKAVDHDDMVVNALLYGSAFGMLYRIIRHVQGVEALNPITGFATVQGATTK
jgi:hypothetical protein